MLFRSNYLTTQTALVKQAQNVITSYQNENQANVGLALPSGEDAAGALYKKFVVQDDRLLGAVLVGEAADALWYRDLIRDRAPLGSLRDGLAFGRSMAFRLAA